MGSEVNHTGRAHALLSASGSERWINCPASPRLEENFPEETSPYAEEGTLAHEFAEIMLKVDLKLMTMSDYRKAVADLKKHKAYYSDIQEDLKPYVDYVKQQFAEAKRDNPFAKIMIEQKFDLQKYVEGGFGTADCIIVSAANIEVIDLKFGAGKLVNAQDDTQLKYYALGALDLFGETTGWHVKATIVQPRMDNIQSAGMTSAALRQWGAEVLRPKAQEAHTGEGDQVPGDWCQFCKARPKCRALHDMTMETIRKDFQDPKLIDDNELLAIYGKSDFITKWLGSVKDHIFKEALEGKDWKGFKLVEGRSNRQWSDEGKAIAALEENLFEPEQYLNTKIKGLGDLEKLMGKKSFDLILGPLTVKPAGSPTLVVETDKRPTFGIAQLKKDFAEPIEEDDDLF